MSLTLDDLQAIRTIVEESVNPIKGEIVALRNDVKDIYGLIDDLQQQVSKN